MAKANVNKGAKKQAAWVEMVRSIQASKTNISKSVNSVLQAVSAHENIPRKKKAFMNFMQNSFRYLKMNDVEAAWGLLEEEMAKSRAEQAAAKENGQGNGANGEAEAKSNGVAVEESAPKQNGSAKKRKLDEEEDSTSSPTENGNPKKVKTAEETNFNWSETIKDIVLSKNNQIKMKKLKKRVFDKYKNVYNVSKITDKFEKKFTKRLAKLGLVVEDDTVRLIQ